MSVFQADGANDGPPVQPCADGIETGVEGIVLNPARLAQGVGEEDQ